MTDRVFALMMSSLAFLSISILIAVAVVVIRSSPVPTFTYTHNNVTPRNPILCAGQNLIIPLSIESRGRRSTRVVHLGEGIVTDSGVPAVRPNYRDSYLFPTQSLISEDLLILDWSFLIPFGLQPGHYRYIQWAREIEPLTQPDILTAEFEVISCE